MALTPLIVAAVRLPDTPGRTRRAFALGLMTGGAYFAGTLYWLVETMTTFGGLATPIAVVAAALLVAYLALFPAAFTVIVAQFRASFGGAAALWLAPAVWVATELGRQYVWDGFPWELLGYSQVTVLPIAQLASVVGVYGLSGLLLFVSTAVAMTIVETGRSRWIAAVIAVTLVVGVALWGRARLNGAELANQGTPIRVAVLQGNIAQDDKWNPALADRDHRYLHRHDAPGVFAGRCSSSGPSRRRRSCSKLIWLGAARSAGWRSRAAQRCSSAATRSNRWPRQRSRRDRSATTTLRSW